MSKTTQIAPRRKLCFQDQSKSMLNACSKSELIVLMALMDVLVQDI